MPERKQLDVQLDGIGLSNLQLLAEREGISPEELAAKIINKELDRMSRPPPSRGKVRSIGRRAD
ncbi:hypothetical protein PSE10C_37090 [Pseudomonas amygdali pv. eriobotryae]|uniref:Uncharacterized protein n=1 Tax=Pseudomonas amygdali pv. eriobotryae TaxID=129137 RepID=A0A9P3AG63_PSEA0|nr:hypothetical protein AL052_24570 [Pseudomonas amygdali pv. eriobotryae]GFZ62098.1 hypothetical protein PSE10A_46090 [Pseudomonas amygdali pv. eriobotryae]GFZ72967.1 hypothetical protein PSE10C_37090 [Pseudomonas amygdali pv. eriobotryae]